MGLERYQIEPIKGLVFEAYMSRKDVGSGIRSYMIYKVGHKYVYLFYAPRLQSVRLTRAEWDALYIQPITKFTANTYRYNVSRIAADFARYGRKHSQALVKQVLAVEPTCGLALFEAKGWAP